MSVLAEFTCRLIHFVIILNCPYICLIYCIFIIDTYWSGSSWWHHLLTEHILLHSSMWWQRHIIKWNYLLSGSPRGVPQLSGLRVERESSSWTRDLHQLYRPEHGAHLWLHHCLVGIHSSILSSHWVKNEEKNSISHQITIFLLL